MSSKLVNTAVRASRFEVMSQICTTSEAYEMFHWLAAQIATLADLDASTTHSSSVVSAC